MNVKFYQEDMLNQDDYQDRVDTFRNTLLTQANRISKLYNDIEKNTVAHVASLKNNDQIISWNVIADNIEEAVEVIEDLVLDLQKYDQLWADYLGIEED
jgi:hypothetical protein